MTASPIARRLVAVIAVGSCALSLGACSSDDKPAAPKSTSVTVGAPAPSSSAGTAETPAATETAASETPAAAETTAAGADLTPIKGTYATVQFPATVGKTLKLSAKPVPKEILTSGNYMDDDGRILSIAVNKGQLENAQLEIGELSEAKPAADRSFVCGLSQATKKPSCVAVMQDALVRLRSYGTPMTVDQASQIMTDFVAAQK